MDVNICKYLKNDSVGLGKCGYGVPDLPIWIEDLLHDGPAFNTLTKNPDCDNCSCFARVKT